MAHRKPRSPVESTDGERVYKLITGHMKRQLDKLTPEWRKHVIKQLRVHLEGPYFEQKELPESDAS